MNKALEILPKGSANLSPTPIWIRMPGVVGYCPYTGLSRAKLYRLAVPSSANKWKPSVLSKTVREPGQKRCGTRIVNFKSLMDYLDALPTPETENQEAAA